MCSDASEKSQVPFHAYELTLYTAIEFSKANETLINSNRSEVIKAVRNTISSIDFTSKPEKTSEDPKPDPPHIKGEVHGDPYGFDPKSLNPLLAELILRLRAIETLPELVVMEATLARHIQLATQDQSAGIPWVDAWDIYEEPGAWQNLPEKKKQRHVALFAAKNAQRNLIILMQILMREANYQPALNNELEKIYQSKLASNPSEVVEIPYSEELRNAVRASAQQWVKEHP